MTVKNGKPKHLKKFMIYCFGVKLTGFTDSKKKFPLLSIILKLKKLEYITNVNIISNFYIRILLQQET